MANLPQEPQGTLSASAPGTSGYNPAWFAATDIYWDPQAGSDAADGLTVGTPVATFAEIVRRYGNNRPTMPYGQTTTCHQLSAQNAGVDEVYFEPVMSGGGMFVLLVTLASAGADFAAGALGGGFGRAGAVPSAGGTAMTMAAVPGYVVKFTLLQNSTRGGYAFVDSVSAGTATLVQPHTVASLAPGGFPNPTVQNNWVAGDNIKAWTCQLTNLGRWAPRGGDLSAGFQPSGGFVQFARIASPDGANSSIYAHHLQSAVNTLSCCQIDGNLYLTGEAGIVCLAMNCVVAGTSSLLASPQGRLAGGSVTGLAATGTTTTTPENNAILHGSSAFSGRSVLGQLFSDGTLLVSTLVQATTFAWGSFACTVLPGGTYENVTGSTFVLKALLTNGTLKLGTATTGSKYQGAGVFVDAVALTPANIDTGGTGGVGLQDPVTGARFCNAA